MTLLTWLGIRSAVRHGRLKEGGKILIPTALSLLPTNSTVGIKIYPPSFERPCRTRYHDLTAELSQNLPRFTVPADGILVLAQPSEFYSILLAPVNMSSPSLRGIMAKIVPPRFNEGWGTWHAKIYGADDDLIISGLYCFFGSKGISGQIPEGYTFLEQKFMKVVRKTARNFARIGFLGQGNVELREWEKEGWTYHAKGLWLSPPADSAPVLTLFGSMNLNSRSADIDTELLTVSIFGFGCGGVSGPGTGRRLAMKTGPKADVDVDGSNHGREVGNLDPIYNLRLQLARKVVKDRPISGLYPSGQQ
ncbi:hypothetical protein D9757_012707 [Collybiopsis confluens]|uniref:CDP-diacylglycerol--glycerol-3-phosphate 3-phosphatidyltransferase n=1 Tax=Collybiopsis confluens TaxID=2823264 RepID=A0A8H5LQC6_9AGAR|nr:hypothetical protein D9757_012707 [Collybiopsis confluens]